jgi:hypothetical protein
MPDHSDDPPALLEGIDEASLARKGIGSTHSRASPARPIGTRLYITGVMFSVDGGLGDVPKAYRSRIAATGHRQPRLGRRRRIFAGRPHGTQQAGGDVERCDCALQ